jgi:hypothetical protein
MSPFCEASVTYVRASGAEEQQGWQQIDCSLRTGHVGPHGDGYGYTWTDPWAPVTGGSAPESGSAPNANDPLRRAP